MQYGVCKNESKRALEIKQKNSKSSNLKTIIKNAKKTAKDNKEEKQKRILEKREKERSLFIQNHLDTEKENLQKLNDSKIFHDSLYAQTAKSHSKLFKNQFIATYEEEEKQNKSNHSVYFKNFSASPIKKSKDYNNSIEMSNLDSPGRNNLQQEENKSSKKGFNKSAGSPLKERINDANQKSKIIQELINEENQSSNFDKSPKDKINKSKKNNSKMLLTDGNFNGGNEFKSAVANLSPLKAVIDSPYRNNNNNNNNNNNKNNLRNSNNSIKHLKSEASNNSKLTRSYKNKQQLKLQMNKDKVKEKVKEKSISKSPSKKSTERLSKPEKNIKNEKNNKSESGDKSAKNDGNLNNKNYNNNHKSNFKTEQSENDHKNKFHQEVNSDEDEIKYTLKHLQQKFFQKKKSPKKFQKSPKKLERPEFENEDFFKETDEIIQNQMNELRKKRQISPFGLNNNYITTSENIPLKHAKEMINEIKETQRSESYHNQQKSLRKNELFRNKIEHLSQVLVDKFKIRGLKPIKSLSPTNLSPSRVNKTLNSSLRSPKFNDIICGKIYNETEPQKKSPKIFMKKEEDKRDNANDDDANNIIIKPNNELKSKNEHNNIDTAHHFDSKARINQNQQSQQSPNVQNHNKNLNTNANTNNYVDSSYFKVDDEEHQALNFSSIMVNLIGKNYIQQETNATPIMNENELYNRIKSLINDKTILQELNLLKTKVLKMKKKQELISSLTPFEENVFINVMQILEEKEQEIQNKGQNRTNSNNIQSKCNTVGNAINDNFADFQSRKFENEKEIINFKYEFSNNPKTERFLNKNAFNILRDKYCKNRYSKSPIASVLVNDNNTTINRNSSTQLNKELLQTSNHRKNKHSNIQADYYRFEENNLKTSYNRKDEIDSKDYFDIEKSLKLKEKDSGRRNEKFHTVKLNHYNPGLTLSTTTTFLPLQEVLAR